MRRILVEDRVLKYANFDRENIINEIYKLTEKLCTTDKDKEEIFDYINYNEYGIAFEVLRSIIEQENIKVSCDDFNIIEGLGAAMGFEEGLWNKIGKEGE